MRVLITGVTGMIGSHLSTVLAAQGHEVHGISRATSLSRMTGGARPYRHYAGDVLDKPFLERVWRIVRPELVFHLAAQAYNGVSWDAEDTTYLVNVQGSRNILDACRFHSPEARVIPACSSAEYGFIDRAALPIMEDTTPLRPITPYGVSKACMEMMARQYALNYGMDVVLPRLFIHVGPDHPPVTALQNFAMQLAEIKLGRRAPVMKVGNLATTRDFVDVRDGVEALALLAARGAGREVYNICTGVEQGIEEALHTLIEISGVQVQIEQDASLLRPSDEAVLLGCNKKLSALGWRPRYEFRTTLEDIYANWLQRLG